MVEQAALVIPVIFGGRRNMEETVTHQPIDHIKGDKRCAIGQFHNVEKFIYGDIIPHGRYRPFRKVGRINRGDGLASTAHKANSIETLCHEVHRYRHA